ncbi:hypothetical protein MKW94_004412 [Papaver nudicaule]|uniref:RNA helicase n=1 Tax=Papaver nudicaule TaxID=74823 RepID=A0AA42B5S6_PAPNU|nr:hypothetical protein [Papaver nudicaule]
MLTTAPLNLPFSIKTTTTSSSSPNFNIISSSKFENAGLFLFNQKTTRGGVIIVRSSGYIRKNLDTPGAYQLIDDETGEKVIVWGDDDSPLPSKETLKWKPNQTRRASREEEQVVNNKKMNENGGYVKTAAAAPVTSTRNDDLPAVRKNAAGSFGKLKAQRVSALIRKSSLTKETNAEVGYRKEEMQKLDTGYDGSRFDDSERRFVKKEMNVGATQQRRSISRVSQQRETSAKNGYGKEEMQKRDKPYNGSRFDDSERGFVKRETNVGATQQRRSISRVSRQREIEDIMPDTETVVSASEQDFNPRRIMGNVMREKSTMSKPSDDDDDDYNEVDEPAVSVPRRAPDASLRGWGGGVSVYDNTSYDTRHYLKHPKKISVGHGFFSRKTFRDLGCSDDVVESLRGQNFSRPSHIQAMAFAPVSEGKTCIVADQSGSGKTLAYLAPVLQQLRQEELQGLGKSSPGCPRVVILVPTAELGSQVLSACRSMSKCGLPFRSMVATGGFRQKTQLESLQQDIDVLIATPGRFLYLLNEGFLQLTNLKCAVLDEVDILFADEDFQQVLHSFLNFAPVTTQYLFVTATLPVEIYNKLVESFPDAEVIMGPGIHRTSSRLEEVLVDCSGDDRMEKTPETAFENKKSALLRLLEGKPVFRTIIFCNKIETCRKVENILNRYDRKGVRIRGLPFHSALTQEARLANMKEFLNPQSTEDSLFLICTDRASRGIDFMGGVDHVILFDFPRDPSEYVRRVGRTARGAGGGIGKAFVFVVGKQVSLAQRIVERNLKGHPLHDVPNAYSPDW